jgi:hypothetical protein
MERIKIAAFALMIVGGVVLTFPGLYSGLTTITGGTAYVQIVIGAALVLMGLYVFFFKKY